MKIKIAVFEFKEGYTNLNLKDFLFEGTIEEFDIVIKKLLKVK